MSTSRWIIKATHLVIIIHSEYSVNNIIVTIHTGYVVIIKIQTDLFQCFNYQIYTYHEYTYIHAECSVNNIIFKIPAECNVNVMIIKKYIMSNVIIIQMHVQTECGVND